MIHYSCDRCKRSIEGQDSVRYVLRMEIEATIETDDREGAGLDQDSLLEMDELLDNLEDGGRDANGAPLFDRRRYDLCPECYRQFVKNPLAREKLVPFGFSKN